MTSCTVYIQFSPLNLNSRGGGVIKIVLIMNLPYIQSVNTMGSAGTIITCLISELTEPGLRGLHCSCLFVYARHLA